VWRYAAGDVGRAYEVVFEGEKVSRHGFATHRWR
jgi:hypothetical protein